jgi:hypothetical protein
MWEDPNMSANRTTKKSNPVIRIVKAAITASALITILLGTAAFDDDRHSEPTPATPQMAITDLIEDLGQSIFPGMFVEPNTIGPSGTSLTVGRRS